MSAEQNLVKQCKAGGREAFQTLYCLYAPLLLSVIRRYIDNEDTVRDLLHDSFLKIIKDFQRFEYRGEGSLRAWLSRVCINQALMWLRSGEHRFTDSMESIPIQFSEEPQEEEVDKLSEEQLMSFIRKLPVGYRTVFNLYVFENLSHREIGQALGINEKSSSSQLARAKKILANQIKAYWNSKE
ncbi:RNA polymerase sigma factor [Porphyromonas macacae]|uniref:Sigma-24 n=1 Tax=Porphyromonas macacae TaxID=28115 RepID=A0A379DGA2_9PORP|nr:sigma-70 family RNA polymerase sigma factor [Porphyromonas macacae]SUB77389.1 Sigma-24 [Porphyromonas macacae]